MPVYDYRCPKCGEEFEVNRPRSEAGNPALCPKDGAVGVRLFTSVGILRGAGDTSSSGDDFGLGGMGGMGGDFGQDHGHSHGPGSHTH
jgi:putative FmdB family regulatory protein